MVGPRDQHGTNAAYYARNRGRELTRVRVRQEATIAFLRNVRRTPCMDCGLRFAPHQMDFDHRDGAFKSFRLTSGGAMLKARSTLLSELSKCDVVCANCHRIRSQTRQVEREASEAPTSRYLVRKRAAWREQAELLRHLRDVPCTDCGQRFSSCAMDFDHRDPQVKAYTVTRMIGRAGMTRILDEIAKCDIVCANCHRVRTYDRRMAVAARE